MSPTEQQAIVALSLLAAFVDGDKHERERAEIKRIAEGLAGPDGVNLPSLYQDVLMKRLTLASVAAALTTADARHLAYEMAVCVCDADGVHSKPEQAFLADARSALGLDAGSAQRFTDAADAVAAAPLGDPVAPAPAAAPSPAAASTPKGNVDTAALDAAILKAAITNGALELLPETLSTMAIIPLQMRLVYRIGQAYGFELDSGHIKDFLATVGVGLTSQYLEQAGRKLLGGLLGRVGGAALGRAAGGLLRGVGNQAVSSGMSFAATYALGHVAQRYYAGGRSLNAQVLKDTYARLAEDAQSLYSRHLPDMQAQARTLDSGKILAMVRGQ